jgi:(S)-2-hydroxy-acid oxidase
MKMAYINVADYERQAKQKLPLMVYDFYAAGACDEITLKENEAAYRRIRLRPRVLRNVSHLKMESQWLQDQRVMFPLGIAPTAMQCMAHPDGELATVRGKQIFFFYQHRTETTS